MSTAQQFWYQTVEDKSLRQGDIFVDLTCYWFDNDLAPDTLNPSVLKATGTWIVAQASCDMEARGLTRVVVLEVLPASRKTLRIDEQAPEKELSKRLEVIRRGAYPRRFLIPECSEGKVTIPMSVVVWDNLATLPTEYLRHHYCNGPRLRLRSPLREKFGNWVGARFSAVGPEDDAVIPHFVRIHDHQVLTTSESMDVGEPPP